MAAVTDTASEIGPLPAAGEQLDGITLPGLSFEEKSTVSGEVLSAPTIESMEHQLDALRQVMQQRVEGKIASGVVFPFYDAISGGMIPRDSLWAYKNAMNSKITRPL